MGPIHPATMAPLAHTISGAAYSAAHVLRHQAAPEQLTAMGTQLACIHQGAR